MGHLISAVVGGVTLLYPIAVYFGIQYLEPWTMAVFLSVVLLLKLISSKTNHHGNRLLILLGLVFCVLAIWNNNQTTLRFYPVVVSYTLFMVFFSSLFYAPPMIERLARLQHPDLPEQGIRYTRKVTQVWCLFFLINGSIALITAVWTSFEWWSLYNGFISYCLMALLMGIEYLVRIRTQKHLHKSK